MKTNVMAETPEKSSWITLHRKIMQWEWYTDANTMRLFLHLLLKASHRDYRWRGVDLKRGQVITGRKILAKELKLSEQEIRTSINKLKSTNEITTQATNRYTMITVSNYNVYQDKTDAVQPARQPTEHPTINQQSTTYNNYNKSNNRREREYSGSLGSNARTCEAELPSLPDVISFFSDSGLPLYQAEQFHYYLTTLSSHPRSREGPADWKAAAMQWASKNVTQAKRNNGPATTAKKQKGNPHDIANWEYLKAVERKDAANRYGDSCDPFDTG